MNTKSIYELKKINEQATEQGARTIRVLFRDKESFQIIGARVIKRSELAKFYHEQRVHAANGQIIVEI